MQIWHVKAREEDWWRVVARDDTAETREWSDGDEFS